MHRQFLQTGEKTCFEYVFVEFDVALQHGQAQNLEGLELLLRAPLVGVGMDNDIFGEIGNLLFDLKRNPIFLNRINYLYNFVDVFLELLVIFEGLVEEETDLLRVDSGVLIGIPQGAASRSSTRGFSASGFRRLITLVSGYFHRLKSIFM